METLQLIIVLTILMVEHLWMKFARFPSTDWRDSLSLSL